MRLFRFIMLIAFAGLCSTSYAVVLSEIMFNPEGEESSDEFIELYNESSLPVNMSGWMVSDGEGTDTLVGSGMGLTVGPRQFVLIIDPDYIEDGSTTYDGLVPEIALVVTISSSTFGSRGLSNSSAETVTIMQANENVVAEFTYSIDIDAGHSSEKIVMNGGDAAENWGESIELHGTPGFRNSITPPDHDLSIRRFEVSPTYPEAGENVFFEILIENLGLNTANDSLYLLELDSLADMNREIVMAWQTPLLEMGDSALFEHSIQMTNEGARYFQALLASYDDDSVNNTAYVTLGAAANEGSVLINEIMYQPLTGRSEWIELYNMSSSSVLMNGWSFADGSGLADSSKRFVIESVLLDTSSFLILAADSVIFSENIPDDVRILVWNSSYPSLNNAGDSLALKDGNETVIDRVDYQPNWGNGAAGFSLERVSAHSASNDPLNWASSFDVSGSTPGRINSRTLPELTADDNLIVLEPNPFSPDGDGRDDILAIRYHLEEADSRLDIKIFDVRGRQVRFLSNNIAAGYQGEVLWDGKSDAGRDLPTGMYIVYLEALGQGGNRIQSGRRVVALARPS